MISAETIAALAEARRHTPSELWGNLVEKICAFPGCPTPDSTAQALQQFPNRDAAWLLSKAYAVVPGVSWSELAGAMAAVDLLAGQTSHKTEIIWTGPANGRFPVRRIDQVLYDLVTEARQRIVLVTFAAHRIQHLCKHLAEAVARGVKLTLIIESEDASEGQLSIDALNAFRNLPLEKIEVFYWPAEKRERNEAGRPGKLHVKCAVVDDTAIIGSANFTDDAFNRNMELGLLLRDEALVESLVSHFEELMHRGDLRKLDLTQH